MGPLKDENGAIKTDDESMVDILNSFFSSVFTREDLSDPPQPRASFEGEVPLTSIHITPEKVTEKLGKLRPGSAPGSDKIYPRILNTLKEELSIPLAIIFNKSLTEGVVPIDWKVANVTPIFKKGSKTEPGNYRPVSLTSVVCRVMESLLRDSIVSHLTLHSLINKTQHGFVPNRSCLTNLLEYLEKMTDLIDQGHSVDIFYLDFAKAFDKVPHVQNEGPWHWWSGGQLD